jgi:enoyl-CoA hydratase/carnithine racemase
MAYETIIYEVRNGVAWVTLNRPDALNAINDKMMEELWDAFDTAADDDHVALAAITGNGRAFCAGADLKFVLGGLETEGAGGVLQVINDAYKMFAHIGAFPKPLIGAINGIAAAGGIELTLCCDIVLAAESARLGDAHSNYGLLPGGGSSARLPRKIGPARAKYLLYSGDLIPAQTLCDWGMVHQVTADDQLLEETGKLADRLASKSPLVLRRMKWMVDEGLEASIDTALRNEVYAWDAHAGAEDLMEGLTAFRDKRTPEYKGR